MNSEKRKRILISGYYGHGNTGDEAILFCILEQLKGHDLTVISLDPEYTKRVQGHHAIDFFNTDEVEEAIKKSDMVIMGGGGLFQEFPDVDYYETKVSYLFQDPYGKLMAYSIVPIIAAIYNKSLVFLGQGVGSFYSEESKAFYGFILSLPFLITVRDQYSYAWVNKLGRNKMVHLSADPAFLLKAENEEKIGNLLSGNNLKEKGFITLSLRDLLYQGLIQNTLREVAQTLNDFLKDNELKVLFIPFQDIKKKGYPTQDRKIALDLLDMLDKGVQERVLLLKEELRPQEILSIINKSLFGIGMRYHFLIFSFLNNIPAVSISYDEKCNHLMKEVGLEDLSVNIFEINHGLLLSKINRVFNHIDEYKKILTNNLPQMKKRALHSFSLLHHTDNKEISRDIEECSGNEKIDTLNEIRKVVLYEDEKIKDLKNELHGKGRAIEKIQAELSDKEGAIEKIQAELSDKGRIIEEKGRTIKELDSRLSQAYTTLNLIYNSRTWRLGQFYGKLLYHTNINKIIAGLIDKIIPGKDNRQFDEKLSKYKPVKEHPPLYVEEKAVEDEIITKLENIIDLINNRGQKGIFVVTSAFEFDEFYNQRVINLSKFLARSGYIVIYIGWRWSKDNYMTGICEEVYPNVFNVPVDYLFDHYSVFSNLAHEKKYFVIEFPHPEFFHIMLHLKETGFTVFYDIADDWREFHKVNQAPWFKKDYEDAIVVNADILTAVSPPLIEKFASLRSDILLMPNGFSSSLIGEKANISSLDKQNGIKIDIGYFGHLTDSWFDWDTVIETAKMNNDFIFHIIGYGEPEEIRSKASKYNNIRLYGKVHPSELHMYVKDWEVAILPFKNSALSNAVDPIKIYEYLYFGLPTVVQGIEHLNSMPYVKNCNTLNEFQDAIREFAEKNTDNSISYKEIEGFLSECSWEKRFAPLLTLLERELM